MKRAAVRRQASAGTRTSDLLAHVYLDALFTLSTRGMSVFGRLCWSKGSLSVGKYLACGPSVQRQIHKVPELG